jgi:threonine/homoserine/homoserine lactone efflux protein
MVVQRSARRPAFIESTCGALFSENGVPSTQTRVRRCRRWSDRIRGSVVFAFLLETVAISLSGVMAPGPITAVTVARGNESPHAGAWVAVGHGLVEFPLILAVFYGLGHWFEVPAVQTGIGTAGGLFLLYMGLTMLRSNLRRRQEDAPAADPLDKRRPVTVGALLSLGSPYFLIWWATIGAALTLRASDFGLAGVLAFASVHWSCDLGWLVLLSWLSYKGGRVFGQRFQQAVLLVCGVFLVLIGGRYVVQAGLALFG